MYYFQRNKQFQPQRIYEGKLKTMRFEKDSDHVKSIHYFIKKSTETMTEIETEKPHKTFAEKIAPIPSLESDEERIK